MKKYLIIIFTLFMFVSEVNAEACDYKDIKRLKEIAEGVEITYELQEPSELLYTTVYDNYKLNITGLTDEIYVFNETDKINYFFGTNFDEEGMVTSGRKTLQIKSKNCTNTLKKVTLKLPIYNYFHDEETCQEKKYKDLDVCQKWTDERITNEMFSQAIDDSDSNETQTKDFKIDFKLIVGIAVASLILLIIFLIYKRKKGVLE